MLKGSAADFNLHPVVLLDDCIYLLVLNFTTLKYLCQLLLMMSSGGVLVQEAEIF